MKFKKNKYLVIKKAVPKELANFLFNYTILKKNVYKKLINDRYLSPYTKLYGQLNDAQVPNTYSHYADTAMEVLLAVMREKMEKATNLNLIETYSFFRVYKKGDVLERHVDRKSCAVSTTINLGGDPWPIYVDPTGKTGQAGMEINLDQGDMLVYSGCEVEHWREEFEGELCSQVFLHYNLDNEKAAQYDGRPFLGLPGEYKK